MSGLAHTRACMVYAPPPRRGARIPALRRRRADWKRIFPFRWQMQADYDIWRQKRIACDTESNRAVVSE